MAKFKIVTETADDTKMTINLDLVTAMWRVDESTQIKFVGGYDIEVKETPDAILQQSTMANL
jgi:hypothetical protein